MKRLLSGVFGGALFVALGAGNASALSLTPAMTTCTTNDNTNFGMAQVLSQVDGCFGTDLTSLDLLYKQNVGGGEEGVYATSYTTVFNNTALDPADALISYVSGPKIFCTECYLVVKDGNHSPAQYFFDLSGWNGTDSLNLTGFWPQQGAISNVAIWGTATVPEPATLLLLGSGLAVAAVRRRRQQPA